MTCLLHILNVHTYFSASWGPAIGLICLGYIPPNNEILAIAVLTITVGTLSGMNMGYMVKIIPYNTGILKKKESILLQNIFLTKSNTIKVRFICKKLKKYW